MKKFLFHFFRMIGKLWALFYPLCLTKLFHSFRDKAYTGFISHRFLSLGNSIIMWHPYHLKGLEYITIGNGTVIETDLELTALNEGVHPPKINIGHNCLIRKGAHITAIDSITIGDDLLTGTNVFITDNSHGNTEYSTLTTSPHQRSCESKGPVRIGNKVWLGNNVCVMPGVTIGDSSIIGANSVVTHDIPAFSVAVGIPAKVIKQVENLS